MNYWAADKDYIISMREIVALKIFDKADMEEVTAQICVAKVWDHARS